MREKQFVILIAESIQLQANITFAKTPKKNKVGDMMKAFERMNQRWDLGKMKERMKQANCCRQFIANKRHSP